MPSVLDREDRSVAPLILDASICPASKVRVLLVTSILTFEILLVPPAPFISISTFSKFTVLDAVRFVNTPFPAIEDPILTLSKVPPLISTLEAVSSCVALI